MPGESSHSKGGQGPNGKKTDPRRIANQEKVKKALALRMAGASFQTIAEQCGYRDRRRAHAAVTRAIREIPLHEATEVKTLELERLDRMQLAIWPQAIKGDEDAQQAMLRIMNRRAKLLGLDAPVRHEGDFSAQVRDGREIPAPVAEAGIAAALAARAALLADNGTANGHGPLIMGDDHDELDDDGPLLG